MKEIDLENSISELKGVASILCMLSVNDDYFSYKDGEAATALLSNKLWEISETLERYLKSKTNNTKQDIAAM